MNARMQSVSSQVSGSTKRAQEQQSSRQDKNHDEVYSERPGQRKCECACDVRLKPQVRTGPAVRRGNGSEKQENDAVVAPPELEVGWPGEAVSRT